MFHRPVIYPHTHTHTLTLIYSTFIRLSTTDDKLQVANFVVVSLIIGGVGWSFAMFIALATTLECVDDT